MKRFAAFFMTLALVLVFSVPAAFATTDNTAKCQKECEAKTETCKKTCAGDAACEKDCAEQEEACKIGCN